MSFICIICNDSLSQNKTNQNKRPDAVLATFCGHLYHQSCLYQNISSRKRSQQELEAKVAPFTCPTCNRVIERQNFMQIFPTEVADKCGNRHLLDERNALPSSELTQLKAKFIRRDSHEQAVNGTMHFGDKNFCTEREIVEMKCTRNGLRKGSQVVCTQYEFEEGVIKWLGTIDGVITAGVEFQKSLDDYFEEINGVQIFSNDKNQARLVPVKELVPHSQFHTNEGKNMQILSQGGTTTTTNGGREQLEIIKKSYHSAVMHIELWLENFAPKIETAVKQEIIDDSLAIKAQLDKCKQYGTEISTNKSLFLNAKKVATILLESPNVPLFEKSEIDRILAEMDQQYEILDTTIVAQISHLTLAFFGAQKCENLINVRQTWLSDAKGRLRCIEKNLITNENQLSELIKELSLLQNEFLSHKHGEISLTELFAAINEFLKYGSASLKFETSTKEIMCDHNQLLQEVETKISALNKTKGLYKIFTTYASEFEDWYDTYLEKLTQIPAGGQFSQSVLISLMQEKDGKRQELVQILNSAKQLRVSIFDSSVLDDRIESLQRKWKYLLEKANEHRVRARKTF